MSIPNAFNPLGYGAPAELDSCGIAHNATVVTGIAGQVRNMRLVLHVGDIPIDKLTDSNAMLLIGTSGGCRRYVRCGSPAADATVFTGSNADRTPSIWFPIKREMQLDITFGTTYVTAVSDGQTYYATIRDFTEPLNNVSLLHYSTLATPAILRFYRAKVYLDDELSGDIVPARQGKKIILWDKVRRVRLEPKNSPLLP